MVAADLVEKIGGCICDTGFIQAGSWCVIKQLWCLPGAWAVFAEFAEGAQSGEWFFGCVICVVCHKCDVFLFVICGEADCNGEVLVALCYACVVWLLTSIQFKCVCHDVWSLCVCCVLCLVKREWSVQVGDACLFCLVVVKGGVAGVV